MPECAVVGAKKGPSGAVKKQDEVSAQEKMPPEVNPEAGEVLISRKIEGMLSYDAKPCPPERGHEAPAFGAVFAMEGQL